MVDERPFLPTYCTSFLPVSCQYTARSARLRRRTSARWEDWPQRLCTRYEPGLGRILLRADPSVEDVVRLGDANPGRRPGPSEVHCAPDLVSHRGLGHVRAFGRVPLALDASVTVQREDLAAISIEELAERAEQLAASARSLIAAPVEAAADREVVEAPTDVDRGNEAQPPTDTVHSPPGTDHRG
jgi:hypothetical protein